MNKLFKTRIAIMLALLVLGIGLFAQTPVISVSMSRSLRIPHSYDDVIMLPNGDLRFLSFTTNRTGLSVSDFRYLAASDTFTVPTELGVISGLNGTPRRSITADRFGKLYTVYRYPRIGTLKGIVVISFGAEGMDYRVINDLDWGYGFDPQHHVDVVAENTLAIALGTGMICYNLNDGSQMTILDGAGYPSDAGFKKPLPSRMDAFCSPISPGLMMLRTRLSCLTLPETRCAPPRSQTRGLRILPVLIPLGTRILAASTIDFILPCRASCMTR